MAYVFIRDPRFVFDIPEPPRTLALMPPRERRPAALRTALLGGAAACAMGAIALPNDAFAQVVIDPPAPDGSNGGFSTYVVYGEGGDGSPGATPADIIGANPGDQNVAGTAITLSSEAGNGGRGGEGFGLGYAIGGHGAQGGQGGYINYSNAFTLTSTGPGMVGLSRGGDGGRGGAGYGAGGQGGNGAAGGHGGSVNLFHSGLIITSGDQAAGVTARSVGGQGGAGGSGGGIAAGGGGGRAGGNGGSAHVGVTGRIETFGDISYGILSQSIGGGGGSGSGAGGVFYAGGGSGSQGGVGGQASATLGASGEILTQGADSIGVMVQSIGGGGGSGGSAGALGGAVGGSGGSGNHAGSVEAEVNGDITTEGERAHGVYVQSIGGGGGNAAGSGGLVAIGGSGAGGGNASTAAITVGATGDIQTGGDDAHGLFAQSIGGGGGSGAGAGGLIAVGGRGSTAGGGAQVDINNQGSVTTGGDRSHAMFAQSIGGGGGAGGGAGGLAGIGGAGSGGGSGGVVNLDNSGALFTSGADSHAMFAQSIGGGGGAGAVGGGLVGVGGSGSGGGGASAVTAINSGAIETTGDRSFGMLVQAIGGGGGAGGGAGGLVAVGGSGSGGGNGGMVTAVNTGDILTGGLDAYGLFAQSIGGGGGQGGSSGGMISVGGSGSGGGHGGVVSVDHDGLIHTLGDGAGGIFAQSVGGGGGAGGSAVSVGAFANVSVGGSGGGGGEGGQVDVATGGQVFTEGDRAMGVFAQSVGGGGGAGGFGAGGSAGAFGNISVGVGGSGGAGGDGGLVTVHSDADVATLGVDSHGIFAQSIGGGGGAGGYSVAASLAAGKAGVAGAVSVGGSGGQGGDARAVIVSSDGDIYTAGDRSAGVYAQSVGGGGGAGGWSGSIAGAGGVVGGVVSVSVGGSGAAGGLGSTVDVTIGGDIVTEGDDSYGVLAQSVGGGGGTGGFSVSAAAAGGKVAGAANVAIGGGGGAGQDSAKVTVAATGDIATSGDRATGILAQSIGGGGGAGGWSGGVSAAGGVTSGAVNVTLGGSGSGGGDGGEVEVSAAGDIWTEGDDATGVLAQSLGGGGGQGGFTLGAAIAGGQTAGSANVGIGGAGALGGDAALVSVDVDGQISTLGDRSNGVTAQSIGGGGGSGGFSGSVAVAAGQNAASVGVGVGGFGGAGGDGGAVSVTGDGPIFTEGDDSAGVLAQSVGGGGGSGGFSLAGGVGAGQNAGSGTVSIGGFGDNGGDGSTVFVGLTNQISTQGDRANGVTAQSIGGGGGAGGWSGTLAVGAGQNTGSAAVSLGGFGDGGGDGDAVTVQTGGDIFTLGVDASGVLAQSIGGGGGSGGFSVAGSLAAGQSAGGASVSLGGAGGSGGDASTVNVTSDGHIRTEGDRARGITAQSIGGGGGSGGWSGSIQVAAGQTAGGASVSVGGFGAVGGASDQVSVTSNGTIGTLGDDATGVFAQSIGGGGGAGGFAVSGAVAAGKDGGAGALSIGGFAGGGGDGAGVDVTSTQLIFTEGDRAHGVHAQSVGGGGGTGGWSGSIAGAFSPGTNASVGLSLGGFGGDGGDAGRVDVFSTGGASTLGDGAHGLFAQSIGGGGGSGGFSVSGAISGGKDTVAITAAVGGTGGLGGDGGAVTMFSEGTVTTAGAASHGVFAQSVGGGGGDGGFAGTLSGGLSPNKAITLGFTVGGFGGGGGLGGAVDVDSRSDIGIEGEGAHAIFAQSIGGGGGNGGLSFGANLAGSRSTNINGRLGGFGGPGSAGGDVTAISSGLLVTRGEGAHGIFAQSVGGGGGTGGTAGGLTLSGSRSVNVSLAMGGLGGAGGVGGAVDVINTGTIDTSGEGAFAVFAQSVGGGGGAGGLAGIDDNLFTEYLGVGAGSTSFGSDTNNVSVFLGGASGYGNDGGAVTVDNNGTLVTRGLNANVIYAQSVGGGGGHAGVAEATSGAFGAGRNGAYAIAMGGQGLGGGDGGSVDVINSGALVSLMGGSSGVFAQSIGGGGGNGGDASGYAQIFSPKARGTTKAQQVSVSIGGSGGAAGDGGVVTVLNSGVIQTLGDESNGVFAQSIGGGGGNGGLVAEGGGEIAIFLDQVNQADAKGGSIAIGGQGAGGGDGGLVDVTNSGLIHTQGQRAHGVFAQSIGGGGGNGGSGLAGELSVGGFGGIAGDGGDVNVTNDGVIVTEGFLSRGIFAQSIGGGGGNGGATDYDIAEGEDGAPYTYRDDLTDVMGVTGDLVAAYELAESFQQPAFGLSVGGSGGAAGDGGDVTVLNTGAIYTSGVLAHGIFAQSVGGGGGTGGEGSVGQVGQIVFSGVGGSGGDGGDVSVTHTGDIVTEGYGAYGIFAQSVGGGGGVAGDVSLGIGDNTLKLGINAFAGAGGDGGDVVVDSSGDIFISDPGGMGIFAQSVGGGGGLYGSSIGLGFMGSFGNAGVAGSVTVNHTGNVQATGLNGVAAIFQSDGTDGQGDITAVLNGHFRGGGFLGKGVFIEGGANNTVTINGSASAVSGLAIEGTDGDDAIINNGVVVGNVDLDGSAGGVTPFAATETNAFLNNADAVFVTLDYVDLGGGLLTNHGLIAPGDAGVVQTTEIDGGLLQTADAVFDLDMDFALTDVDQETDRLTLNGAANVAGQFELRVANVGSILPGEHVATIISADAGLTDNGVILDAPQSAVASFALEAEDDALNLRYVVDFSPAEADWNHNREAVGDYINRIQLAGSSAGFEPVAEMLFRIPGVDTLAGVYDSFMPEIQLDNLVGAAFSAGRFTDAMMSCPQASTTVVSAGGECMWVRAEGRELAFDETFDTFAFDEQTRGLQLGYERALAGTPLTLGAALSYEDVEADLIDRARANGDRRQAGLTVRADLAVDLSLALSFGSGNFDVERGVVTPSGAATAVSTQKFNFTQATARVSRALGDSALYIRPVMEVSVTRLDQHAHQEQGAGPLNLRFEDQSQEIIRLRPSVEFGGEFGAGAGVAVRPWAAVGVSHVIGGDVPSVMAEFAAAPSGVDPFRTGQPLDAMLGDVRVGFDVVNDRGFGARFSYSGQFGDKTEAHAFSVKLTQRF